MKRKIIILIVLSIVLVSFWLVSFLDNKVEILNSKVKALKEKEKKLIAQSKMHALEINDRVKDINELNTKLDFIEEQIGINHSTDTTEIQRVDFAKMTAKERTYILSIIPNGSPTKLFSYTSGFGYRTHPITKVKKFHRGLDFKAKRKTPIYATADGVVKYVHSKNSGSFGRLVIISHNYGFETLFAHLRKTKVNIGDVVYKGDLIALSGNSGRSSGPHLHYEIKFANKSLNPINFVKWNLKNYDLIFKKEKRVNWKVITNQIKVHEIAINK